MTSPDTLVLDTLKDAQKLVFGRRIAYMIEKRGLSKAWVAERLGVSKQALNYLLKHAIKPKFVDELAEILNLNPEWVETGVGLSSANDRSIYSTKQIPLLTKADVIATPTGPWDVEKTIDFSSDARAHFIAYALEDDSNFPPFIQGSILIFNTEKQPQSNDYVLVIIEDNVFVRQYLMDGNNQCYKASNNTGHKTFINPKAKLLGVLVEARYQIN